MNFQSSTKPAMNNPRSTVFRGSRSDFLSALLAMESGIDMDQFPWYVENFDQLAMAYAAVEAPGRIARDAATGTRVEERITVREYFSRLDVLHLFDDGRPLSIKNMQYHSTNALGFIGYQFGEAVLISSEYYEPARVEVLLNGKREWVESYYVGGIPDKVWARGVRQVLHRPEGQDAMILATDVNLWKGKFTGKNGVSTLDDLKSGEKQDAIMSDILLMNEATLLSLLRHPSMLVSPERVPGGHSEITLSGILAAAHLCGAWGVAKFLNSGVVSADEFGTSILLYLQKFSGYELCSVHGPDSPSL